MKKMIFTLLLLVVFMLGSTNATFAMDFFQSEVLIATESVNVTEKMEGTLPGVERAVFGWTELSFNARRRALSRLCRSSSFEQILSWKQEKGSNLFSAAFIDKEKLYHVILSPDSNIVLVVPDTEN